MLSTIYRDWRILIMWWVWWLLVAAFWIMIHTRRLWEDRSKMENTWWRSSGTSCHLIGIFVTAMWLMITTTSGMNCHQLNIHGWLIGGIFGCLLSFCSSQKFMHIWFHATLSTMGYVGRECLHYWSFIGSWRGKLLPIYTFGERNGGVELLPDSIHQLMNAPRRARIYQNQKWICTAKTAYKQYSYRFKLGGNIIIYCVCIPGVWVCSYCNVQYVLIANSDD